MDRGLPGGYLSPVSFFRSMVSVVVLLVGVCGSRGQAKDVPQLELDPPQLNLGAVLDLEPIDQSVVVRNTSAEPARIVEVKDSCGGCVGFEVFDDMLDPGEETVLRLRVDPRGMVGPMAVMVVVATPELDRPQRGLRLTADIIPAIVAEGLPVAFPDVSPAQSLAWRVKLIPQVGFVSPFTRVLSDLEHVSGEVTYDEERGIYWVDILADAGLSVGHHGAELRVTTDDSDGLVYTIPVHINVLPSLEVVPGELVLDRSDQEQLRILFVTQRSGTPVQVASVEVPDSRIQYRIPTHSGLADQRINLYFTGLSGAVGLLGDVIITFSDPELNPATIPVYVQDLRGVLIESSCGQSNRARGGGRPRR